MPRTFRAAVMAALLLFAGCHHIGSGDGHGSDSASVSRKSEASEARLEVVGQGSETLVDIPMESPDTWCLLWNHSVAGFTVSDCFSIMGKSMYLVSSHQPDFAAGLGYLEGRGTLTSDGQGGYIITDIHEPVPDNSLVLRVGSMAVNHRVLYQGKETSLSRIAAGQRVVLRLSGN